MLNREKLNYIVFHPFHLLKLKLTTIKNPIFKIHIMKLNSSLYKQEETDFRGNIKDLLNIKFFTSYHYYLILLHFNRK